MGRRALSALWCWACLWSGAQAQEVLRDVPDRIDTEARFLFFQHGLSVEQLGPDSYSKEFRKVYDTTGLTQAFARAGWMVVAEFRPRGSRVPVHAERMAGQIMRLRQAGVPPQNIVVVGHSKGAYIALAAAHRLGMPEIRYALLAGCALPSARDVGGVDARATFERLVSDSQGTLKGRFLSMYDPTDAWMGSCAGLVTANPGLDLEEKVLTSGLPAGMGHSLFYAPEALWFDPLVQWLRR